MLYSYILIISLIPLYIRLYHHAQLIVIIINYYSDSTTTSAAAAEEQKEDFLFEECTVQLPYICNSSTTTSNVATTVNDINSNEETHSEGFHWKLASLSKKLVGLTQINTLQTIKITETTINYIQNEIEEICTAIFQLLNSYYKILIIVIIVILIVIIYIMIELSDYNHCD